MVATHGSSKYKNDGCRCQVCREGNRLYTKARRGNRIEETQRNGGVAVGAERHNRSTYSNWGCRCDLCTDDSAAMARERRRGA